MKPELSDRPRLLILFFQLFAIIGAVPFLINTVDILLHPSAPTLPPLAGTEIRLAMGLVAAPLTMAIAILCIRRVPGNIIGWQLVCFSYGMSVQVLRADLFPLALTLIIGNVTISQFWIAFLLIPLYFPNGRLYPANINLWGNRLVSFIVAFLLLTTIFSPQFTWGENNELSTPNPLFVVEWDYTVVTRLIIPFILATGIITVILRYRGSSHLERLQLRWLFYGMIILGLFAFTSFQNWFEIKFFDTLSMLVYSLLIPTSVGIAVLRYKLYEIDLIIRRTLQYGLLSLLLGLVYFGMVIMLGQAFQGATGQESPLIIVISTLVIAALFNPLRRRIQDWIDRRFFRSRYNADLAVASFSSAARGQVELEALANRLVDTARVSLQPEEVWVWIRNGSKKHMNETRSIQ